MAEVERPTYDVRASGFSDLDPRTSYLLMSLREAVFVVEQQCAYQELDGRDLEPTTRHLWVAIDSEPVAYLRILDDGSHARIGRVLVAQGHRGHGLAGTLMRAALDEIGDRPSRLDAQTYLADWYRGFGYQQTGPEFLDDGIPHVPMERTPTQSSSRTRA